MHPHNDLYTIDPEYIDGIERAGGLAALVGFARDVDGAVAQLSRFDGLLLSGGDDIDPAGYGAPVDGAVGMSPDSDRSDAAYVAAAFQLGLPVLGICRGVQSINVALGGTLLQHIWGSSDHHPDRLASPDEVANADDLLARRHPVELEPGSLVAKLFQADVISVNSLHHQSVDTVADDLVVTGRAPDGIVEVVEHKSERLLGVQWHPERLANATHDVVFEWLVREASGQ